MNYCESFWIDAIFYQRYADRESLPVKICILPQESEEEQRAVGRVSNQQGRDFVEDVNNLPSLSSTCLLVLSSSSFGRHSGEF